MTWDRRADLLLLGVYAVLLALLVFLRAGCPSVFWEHDYAHVGSEKLFNFSLIQAFLFGQGYPPENLWLAANQWTTTCCCTRCPGWSPGRGAC